MPKERCVVLASIFLHAPVYEPKTKPRESQLSVPGKERNSTRLVRVTARGTSLNLNYRHTGTPPHPQSSPPQKKRHRAAWQAVYAPYRQKSLADKLFLRKNIQVLLLFETLVSEDFGIVVLNNLENKLLQFVQSADGSRILHLPRKLYLLKIILQLLVPFSAV